MGARWWQTPRTTALKLLKAADKLTGEERPRQAEEAGRHAADADVHSAQHHERAAQITMQAGQGSEVVVPAWRQAEASWRAAATTYEMAEQPESARQAEASARAAALLAVRGRDMLAFLQQIPTTVQIRDIKNRIAAQLCPPDATGSRKGRFTVSRIEFHTDQGNDVYYQTEFIRHDHTEWLGLRIGDTIVHLITAETALLIIGNFKHSVERRVVELEDFVRGPNLADLLRPIEAPPEGGGAQPPERQANPRWDHVSAPGAPTRTATVLAKTQRCPSTAIVPVLAAQGVRQRCSGRAAQMDLRVKRMSTFGRQPCVQALEGYRPATQNCAHARKRVTSRIGQKC